MDLKPEILHLAALRQSRGITLDSIAERTKISRYYLRAIEDLDFAKLPSGLYRQRFLQQYASAIDADLAGDLDVKLRKAARDAAEAAETAMAAQGIWRNLKELIARGAALLVLFGQPNVTIGQPQQAESKLLEHDSRYQRLLRFLQKHNCPITNLTRDFISAADRNGLDWRLLPSIAFLESSGGKHGTGANMLGWGSGKQRFRSSAHAIHYVAERLAHSPIYAGKDTRTKLGIYNPANKEYARRVFAVMEEMSASGLIAAR